ncbi:MAG: GntR family transcriptional regulator [Phycisphaerae bacterium]|jgi:DNA-binding transcriptional regulator YhcF (GntR family)
MDGDKKSFGKEKFRYLAIAESLEADIAEGKYAIGGKLPSERMLAKQTNASYLTVRQGIGVLAQKGLVRRAHGSGIYVTATKATPIIGMIFGPSLVEESAYFYRALREVLESEIAATPYICRSYDGFNRTDAAVPENSLPYQQLLRDCRSHPIKGFLEVGMKDLKWNDLEPLKGALRATFGDISGDVTLDRSVFARSALEFVVGNNRRKVVYLRNFLINQNDLRELADTAKRLRIPMPEVVPLEDNGQPVDVLAHDKVCQMAMQWNETGVWPEAMIISDDIATRGAAIALIKAGIRIPSEMQLVTLANEGINHHYGVDAVKYVFSPTEVAWKLVLVLEKRMRRLTIDEPQAITGDWASNSLEPANKHPKTLIA